MNTNTLRVCLLWFAAFLTSIGGITPVTVVTVTIAIAATIYVRHFAKG